MDMHLLNRYNDQPMNGYVREANVIINFIEDTINGRRAFNASQSAYYRTKTDQDQAAFDVDLNSSRNTYLIVP